jgi:hypothetical protein
MSSDEFGGLPDREQVLAGLPARRADTLLFHIESRTAYLVERTRRATEFFLTQEGVEEREFAFLEAFALGRKPPLRPTIQDLERYAPQWAPLVPENPRVRAAVAHRLGKKYRFTHRRVPRIREALDLDDEAVRQAYQGLYQESLETIFAVRTAPGEWLRWTWETLDERRENLSPFWSAYTMSFTQTVGAGTVALPIALARIGPLAGVLILVVLGVVNVLTVAFLSEAVSRSGTIRYGKAFIGQLVDDYLGHFGSFVLTVVLFTISFLGLLTFYIGFADALRDTTGVAALVWVALLFPIGLYFLRKQLKHFVTWTLVVSAVNIVLIVTLSVLAFTHLRLENLSSYGNVPFLDGRPFDPAIVRLVFGIVLTAYVGHLSVSMCAQDVLRGDPSGRSLIWGSTAAPATAIILYCLFVLAVKGAITPEVLVNEKGTALDPLAAEVGPIAALLGSVFIVLGFGTLSIHISRGLFNLTVERLPSPSRRVALSRRRGQLLFQERGGDGLRLGLSYLGLSGDKPRFRLDIELDGDLHRVETTAAGRWEVLGQNGDSRLLERLPELRNRGNHLTLEVLGADQQRVQLQVTSSMRSRYDGAWEDTAGLDLANIFALPDSQAKLIALMMRRGQVSLAEAVEHTGQNEGAARADLKELVQKGYVAEVDRDGEPRYEVRLATRRRPQLSQPIWQALGEERDSPSNAETSRLSRDTGILWPLRRLLSNEHRNFFLGASPVVAAFLLAEWLLLTGQESFSGLLSFRGVIGIPLLAGIFPVLLLVASRRKGERVPGVVYRFLGNPLLLAGIYVLFLSGIFLHGLVIWEDPVQRGAALLAGVLVLGMTIAVMLRGAFAQRLIVELRVEAWEDRSEEERAYFSVTAAGRPIETDVQLKYLEGEQRYQRGAGCEIPDFSSLRQATFRPRWNASATPPTLLKVWAHKVTIKTPKGGDYEESEGLAGLLHVRQEFDLKLWDGKVVPSVAPATWQVDITLVEASDLRPGESSAPPS